MTAPTAALNPTRKQIHDARQVWASRPRVPGGYVGNRVVPIAVAGPQLSPPGGHRAKLVASKASMRIRSPSKSRTCKPG